MAKGPKKRIPKPYGGGASTFGISSRRASMDALHERERKKQKEYSENKWRRSVGLPQIGAAAAKTAHKAMRAAGRALKPKH